jgi:hypothetical protein
VQVAPLMLGLGESKLAVQLKCAEVVVSKLTMGLCAPPLCCMSSAVAWMRGGMDVHWCAGTVHNRICGCSGECLYACAFVSFGDDRFLHVEKVPPMHDAVQVLHADPAAADVP